MNWESVTIKQFSTKKLTDTQYQLVYRWDRAFQQWFKNNIKKQCWSRIVILSDELVWSLYGDKIQSTLNSLHIPMVLLLLKPGENYKDFRFLAKMVDTLIGNRVHRKDLLMCAGGGVCCDMGGLLAMLYMRGMDYVNLPTSLIAQIDAAIGGKVGSNFGIHKNLLGGFHHPLQVFIDTSFLNTLPDIHFRTALAEAVKVAIIRENESLFALMEKQLETLLNRQQEQLLELINLCLQGKLELLADDPYETCLDRSLNLGHTVAHALERLPSMPDHHYPLHGEAVAIGLAAAIRYAFKCGLCSTRRAVRLLRLLKGIGLPLQAGPVDPCLVKSQLSRISDHRGGLLRMVVPVDKGGVTIIPNAELDILIECLEPITGLPL